MFSADFDLLHLDLTTFFHRLKESQNLLNGPSLSKGSKLVVWGCTLNSQPTYDGRSDDEQQGRIFLHKWRAKHLPEGGDVTLNRGQLS